MPLAKRRAGFAGNLIEALAAQSQSLQLDARRIWASPEEPERHAVVVCSGLLALYREGSSGSRRLVALRYPGEIIAPHEHGFGVRSVLSSEIVATNSSSFQAAIGNVPDLQRAFEHALKRTQLIAYEWLVRDALPTSSRVAHFLCEHGARLGINDDDDLPLELTQIHLGEITAQTTVNVNRIMASFVKQRLLTPAGSRMYRPDWVELRRLGRFEPSYLA